MTEYTPEIKAAIMLLESEGFIVIDPNKEVTIKDYAKKYKKEISTVSSWVDRNKIKYRIIKQLNNLKLIQPDSLDK